MNKPNEQEFVMPSKLEAYWHLWRSSPIMDKVVSIVLFGIGVVSIAAGTYSAGILSIIISIYHSLVAVQKVSITTVLATTDMYEQAMSRMLVSLAENGLNIDGTPMKEDKDGSV